MGDGKKGFVKENDNGDRESALNMARLIPVSVQYGNPIHLCQRVLTPAAATMSNMRCGFADISVHTKTPIPYTSRTYNACTISRMPQEHSQKWASDDASATTEVAMLAAAWRGLDMSISSCQVPVHGISRDISRHGVPDAYL